MCVCVCVCARTENVVQWLKGGTAAFMQASLNSIHAITNTDISIYMCTYTLLSIYPDLHICIHTYLRICAFLYIHIYMYIFMSIYIQAI